MNRPLCRGAGLLLAVVAAQAVTATGDDGRPLHSSERSHSDPSTDATGEQKVLPGAGSSLGGRVSDLSGEVSSLEARVKALGGTISERVITVPIPADTLFDFDRADIRPEAETDLHEVARLLAATHGTAEIHGHTDSRGDARYNLALSQRRADAVVAWLEANGKISATRLSARGYGEVRPAAPNTQADGSDDPEGRARNRRVEVVIAR